MTLYVRAPAGAAFGGNFPAERLAAEHIQGPLSLSLFHQRFAGRAPQGNRERDRGSPLKDACETFVQVFAGQRQHGEPHLRALNDRLDRAGGVAVDRIAEASGWDHAWRDVRLASPLAIGLGNDHPFENGLTLHHLAGVPMVPGASLKGLGAAWRDLIEADPTITGVRFGWVSEDGKRMHAGRLRFLDALPLAWPELAVDIINNHLPAYYQGSGNPGAVPKESPVPVFLLVVAPGTWFRLRIGAARDWSGRAEHVREALDELAEALSLLGVGACKANGFGIFE